MEEINQIKSLIKEKIQEEKSISNDIKTIENIIISKSGEIVNITKSVSIKNKENEIIKNKFENFRIDFEINRKQLDEMLIKKDKIEEEITVTRKQIKNTQSILLTLNNDIKKPNPKIDIDKIDTLNLTIAFLYEILLPLISTIFIFHDFNYFSISSGGCCKSASKVITAEPLA